MGAINEASAATLSTITSSSNQKKQRRKIGSMIVIAIAVAVAESTIRTLILRFQVLAFGLSRTKIVYFVIMFREFGCIVIVTSVRGAGTTNSGSVEILGSNN